MDATQKCYARLMFKLKIHEADGTAYQRLLVSVLSYRDRDFVPIKPDGRGGDRKNDGYLPTAGVFFQVFAPERPERPSAEVEAAEKAAQDFAGLKARWKLTPIREFRFAFNDKYLGAKPKIEDAMALIRAEHNTLARSFLAKDLEDEAFQLPDDEVFAVLGGPVPTGDYLASIDFSVLGEVIRHIEQHAPAISSVARLSVPDFSDKILFNGLSPAVAHLLTVGSYQSDAVRDYFSRNSRFARQQLRDQLAAIYQLSRSSLTEADLVFFDVLDSMVPPTSDRAAARQQAALVVMAHYFEACDIFEDPGAST